MNPIADTLSALFQREPLAFVLWAEIALLPMLLPMLLVFVRKPQLHERLKFVCSAGARILGYPALFTLLLVVPWTTFELFFVPVLFDAYPVSRSLLLFPLTFTNWLVWNWYWFLPLLWPAWVCVATVRFARSWHASSSAVA